MRKADVEIQGYYSAKISGKVVPIKIIHEHGLGGWQATNLVTGRMVRIKSAQKLRARLSEQEANILRESFAR